jgi:HK97 family phage major capsid protein
METIRDAINELAHTFEEFKVTNDERLDRLEKSGKVDILTEQKLSHLNAEIDRTYNQLNKIQLSFKRPSFETDESMLSYTEQERKSAFSHYIRKGDESKLCQLERKALSVGSDPDGGYLVPQIVSDRIGRELADLCPIRALASIITISSSAVDLLIDKDKAEVGWASEVEERQETRTSNLAKIHIPVHEMYAKPRATQKLLDDARVNIEEWLSNRISTKMAQVENKAFLEGDGNNKPRGFMHYPTARRQNLEWGRIEHLTTGRRGQFAEQNPEDILVDTIHAMKAEYQKDAVWLMSPSVHAIIRKFKDRNGQYLWNAGLGSDPMPTLLGYKVVILEDMPSLIPDVATHGIVFANLKEGYQIVDRAGTRVLRDPFSAKPYVEFYTTKRVGGEVINFDAFKFIKFDAHQE